VILLAAGVVLVLVAATGAAALLRLEGVVSFVLAVGVLAFAETVAVTHALSLFDAYERSWFLATVGVVAVVVVGAVAIARPPRPILRGGEAVRELLRDPLLVVLGAVVIAELTYLAALALLTPPNDIDGLTYHLWRALLWIQQGAVTPIADATDARVNVFPPNAEILQAAAMLLSDSVRWAALVQLTALPVAILAVYGIARRIGLDRRAATFGALLFATLPVVALQAAAPVNDLVVAALVATAAYFALGRASGETVLGCVAVALLIGTKVTGLLALPVLFAVAVLTHRGRRLVLALAGGLVAVSVGAAWYAVNLSRGEGLFGGTKSWVGSGDGVLAIGARFTRHAVDAFDLPGAAGRDKFLYLVAAATVAVVGLALGQVSVAAVGAALAALPLLVLPTERVLYSVYWHGWELVGYGAATRLGTTRDLTLASQGESWYGPVGLVMTLVALVLVVHGVRHGRLPWVALVFASAPIVLVAGIATAVRYHDVSGRFAMSGIALSAATWGLVRQSRAASAAVVVVAATTVLLSLVNSVMKPLGLELLEPTNRPSTWTLPRGWVQSRQPEVAVLIVHVDEHATPGQTIAVARDYRVYPFAYVGWPGIDHRIVYADSLAEATSGGADWAVVADTVPCAHGWRRSFHSVPWAVYRADTDARCLPGNGARSP
jgi:hypothetical protein